MKRLRLLWMFLLLCVASSNAPSATAQGAEQSGGEPHARNSGARLRDEQEIRRLIAVHAEASQRGDLQGLTGVYHDDADVRYSDGTVAHGTAALKREYQEALSDDPHAIAHSHPVDTIHIRFLRPDVAFVDVESVSGGDVDRSGKKEAVTRTPLFVVFTKEHGRWGVAVQRSGVPLR